MIYEVTVHNLDYDSYQATTIQADGAEHAAQMVMADYTKNRVDVRLINVKKIN